MLSALAAEQGYEPAMNDMLRMMSTIIHADRLAVFECGGRETKVTFELCAEGVEPQLGNVFPLDKEMLGYWFRNVTQDHVVLVPNVSIIQRVSAPLYQWCKESGVSSLLAAPFFNGGEIVGFLGAYNYAIDTTIDLNRLFEAVATFIGARIENRQLFDSLKRASSHDVLTDLLNRRGSQVEIGNLLSEDPFAERVLVLLDIDDFKRVNDVYGHDTGDEALRAMTRTLKQAFPQDAILSRNGGDEFLVVLSGDAAKNVRSLLAALSERGVEFDYKGEHHKLTLSIGYARYPKQANNMRELFSKADAALYAVKLAGKAGFGEYTTETETLQRLQLGFSARDVLESVPYPLLVTRAQARGEFLFAGVELAHLLGYEDVYEFTRATEGTFAGIVYPSDRERVSSLLKGYASNTYAGEMIDFRFLAVSKDGRSLDLCAVSKFVDIEETGRVLYTLFSK